MDDANIKPKPRLAALDGLRGYAAIAVLFYHAILLFASTSTDKLSALIGVSVWNVPAEHLPAKIALLLMNGDTAVQLFFVLSGAVLFASLEGTKITSTTPIAFTIRRIMRIFPAMLGCLVAFYAISVVLHPLWPTIYPAFSAQSLLENATLYAMSIHGATWTLQVEMLIIPFILSVFWLKSRIGDAAVVFAFMYGIIATQFPLLAANSAALALAIVYFCAGFMAVQYSKSEMVKDATESWNVVVVLVLIIFMKGITSPVSQVGAIVQCFLEFFLIAHLFSGVSSPLSIFLSGPLSRYLGKISYSFYLWNVPVLYVLGRPFLNNTSIEEHYLLAGLALGIIATAITLPIAHASEALLEKPFIKLMSRRKRAAHKLSPAHNT